MTLTPEQIHAMQAGREMNAAVAEVVMGWHQWVDLSRDYDGPYPMFAAWGEGPVAVYEDEESGDVTRWFSPSTDINDAFEMEAEITKRNMEAYHIDELIEIVRPFVGKRQNAFLFALTHAHPSNRCKAALLVLVKRQEG